MIMNRLALRTTPAKSTYYPLHLHEDSIHILYRYMRQNV